MYNDDNNVMVNEDELKDGFTITDDADLDDDIDDEDEDLDEDEEEEADENY